MNQLLTEIRRADAVQVFADHVDVIRPPQNRLPNEVMRTFQYDAANKQMKLRISYVAPAAPSPWYSLSRNVDQATFGPPDTDPTSGAVTRVPVTLVVKIGNNEVRLSGSSGPRRAAKE